MAKKKPAKRVAKKTEWNLTGTCPACGSPQFYIQNETGIKNLRTCTPPCKYAILRPTSNYIGYGEHRSEI